MSRNNDLISRSALLIVPNVNKVTEYDEAGFGMSYNAVSVETIENAPAVDAEVVRHGRNLYASYKSLFKCSECDWECWDTLCGDTDTYNYCPNCGAKMDGKECAPRKCGTCSNDGWDMPQCHECNEENGFKWYKHKMDAEVKG